MLWKSPYVVFCDTVVPTLSVVPLRSTGAMLADPVVVFRPRTCTATAAIDDGMPARAAWTNVSSCPAVEESLCVVSSSGGTSSTFCQLAPAEGVNCVCAPGPLGMTHSTRRSPACVVPYVMSHPMPAAAPGLNWIWLAELFALWRVFCPVRLSTLTLLTQTCTAPVVLLIVTNASTCW